MSKEKEVEVVAQTDPTTQEKQLTSMQELEEKRMLETQKVMEEYDSLFEELEAGGYFDKGYAPGDKITMDGTLFNQFVSFVNTSMRTHYTIGESLNILQATNEAMITKLSGMTILLMRQHKENADNGFTKTHEELDKLDAKVNTAEVSAKPRSKRKPKKAVGSK